MENRRTFIKKAGILGLTSSQLSLSKITESTASIPMVISTWDFGIEANEVAYDILDKKGSALDAVEQGVRLIESDPTEHSVGIGGMPDRDGKVSLDACIMDHKGNAGSVAFLQEIENPISVARKVMEETPHVMLVGQGALQFAEEQGFKKRELLTEATKKKWMEWAREKKYEPKVNIENHDTIGMIAIDKNQNLAGACTTSGLAFKMHGRVGDSPIIGAGLFVDNEVGAATATGMGELMMKTLGSFLVVELMRQGKSPQQACEEAIMRIVNKLDYQKMQVAYLATDTKGNVGAYSIQAGFSYALYANGKNQLIKADSYLPE